MKYMRASGRKLGKAENGSQVMDDKLVEKVAGQIWCCSINLQMDRAGGPTTGNYKYKPDDFKVQLLINKTPYYDTAEEIIPLIQKEYTDEESRGEVTRIIDELLFSGDGSLDNPFEETECIDQLPTLSEARLQEAKIDIFKKTAQACEHKVKVAVEAEREKIKRELVNKRKKLSQEKAHQAILKPNDKQTQVILKAKMNGIQYAIDTLCHITSGRG